MLVQVVNSVGVENKVAVAFIAHGAGVEQDHALNVL